MLGSDMTHCILKVSPKGPDVFKMENVCKLLVLLNTTPKYLNFNPEEMLILIVVDEFKAILVGRA